MLQSGDCLELLNVRCVQGVTFPSLSTCIKYEFIRDGDSHCAAVRQASCQRQLPDCMKCPSVTLITCIKRTSLDCPYTFMLLISETRFRKCEEHVRSTT